MSKEEKTTSVGGRVRTGPEALSPVRGGSGYCAVDGAFSRITVAPPLVPMEKAVESPLLCRWRPRVDILVAIPGRRRSCHIDACEAPKLRLNRGLCHFPEFINCELKSNHSRASERSATQEKEVKDESRPKRPQGSSCLSKKAETVYRDP